MCKIIVIEGPDRVGKATQAGLLHQRLLTDGYRAEHLEVPIRGNIAYTIVYLMLRTGLVKRFPRLFQWMQYYNRNIFQKKVLPRLLAANDYLVFDRWSLSMLVYGEATGVPKEFTEPLADRLIQPDFTIVLSGISHPHDPEDAYEADEGLQKRVRELYESWALQRNDAAIINCNANPNHVHRSIIGMLTLATVITMKGN